MVAGDFAASGKDGVAGLASDGSIWYTTDLQTWSSIPGILNSLVVGDFNLDGKADLAGLASDRSIWYTTDLQTWANVPGRLASLCTPHVP
jgi:phosphodiesterase/alkaline phosphatase D-like protein